MIRDNDTNDNGIIAGTALASNFILSDSALISMCLPAVSATVNFYHNVAAGC